MEDIQYYHGKEKMLKKIKSHLNNITKNRLRVKKHRKLKKIVSYECFLRLLINTRYCAKKENRIKLITLLAQNTEAYDISYKDCRFVIEFLNATLKERRI